MALDGAFLFTVKQELGLLIGGRIDKIHQPSRDEIIIAFRAKGGNFRLLFNASANAARVHITKSSVENPKSPPMFCMLLRKHLGNGKLISITQEGLERVLKFEFEAMNEIGDMVRVSLYCEIMGRCSNLILVNGNGKIIDSIKRVDEDMSRERLVLPGMTYTFPPGSGKISFITAEKSEIRQQINSSKNQETSKCLLKILEGVSPLLSREMAFFTTRGRDVEKDDLTDDELDRLMFYLSNLRENMLESKNKFTVLLDKEGNLKDFSLVKIEQYGNLLLTREIPTASDTLDYFYIERDAVTRMRQRSHDLLKFLVNTSDRIVRKLALQQNELEICGNRDELKVKGDLISANIYQLKKGESYYELENFYSESQGMVKIDVNPRFSSSQNAQHYYSEYRKAATAEKKLVQLIHNGEEELQYIDSVFDALTRSVSENEVLELKFELAEQGFIKANRLKSKPPKVLPPLEYMSSDGFRILAGRNNKQNDKLTLKMAEKTDIWLHTHDIPGSHVIILTGGEVPPDSTIEEAAVIAAANSKARNSQKVPVDYTFVKYVKKPAGAKPGMVIFTNNQTAYVSPNRDNTDN